MFSRSLTRVSGIVLVCLAGTTASAQYGGGTTGAGGMGVPGGTTGKPNYSYGSGKAIGIGVGAAAGAAVGVALLVHHRHVKARETQSQASVTGCTESMMNGIILKNESDGLTYTILSGGGIPIQSGERVELQGVALNEKSGVHAFSVHKLVDNYGSCGSATAVASKTGGANTTFAQTIK
jgi:hypothetical protein